MKRDVRISYASKGLRAPVYLVSSITDPQWEPVELDSTLQPDGELEFWRVFSVEEGEYQYKFRLGPGEWWALDESKPVVDDGSGNRNNIIKVEPPTTSAPTQPAVESTPRPSMDQQPTPVPPKDVTDKVMDRSKDATSSVVGSAKDATSAVINTSKDVAGAIIGTSRDVTSTIVNASKDATSNVLNALKITVQDPVSDASRNVVATVDSKLPSIAATLGPTAPLTPPMTPEMAQRGENDPAGVEAGGFQPFPGPEAPPAVEDATAVDGAPSSATRDDGAAIGTLQMRSGEQQQQQQRQQRTGLVASVKLFLFSLGSWFVSVFGSGARATGALAVVVGLAAVAYRIRDLKDEFFPTLFSSLPPFRKNATDSGHQSPV